MPDYTINDGEFYKQFKLNGDFHTYGRIYEDQILSFSSDWYYIEWITEEEYNELVANDPDAGRIDNRRKK